MAGDHVTNDNTLSLTGTAEAGATVKVYDGATLLGSAVATAAGAWSFTTGTLNDGAHNLTATATDVAGNTGPASSAWLSPSTPAPRWRLRSRRSPTTAVWRAITSPTTTR